MKKILAFIFIAALSLQVMEAQTAKKMPFNLGLYGGLNFNMHNAQFTTNLYNSPLVVVPVTFDGSSTTLGGNFGLIANIPLDEMFVISGRFGYNMVGGSLKDVTEMFNLKSNLNYFEVSPVLEIHNLIDNLGLYLLGGLELGFPLSNNFTSEYTHPVTGNVLTSEERDIANANTRIALILGLGWNFEISDKIYLSPEISYRLPFNKVSSETIWDSWKVPQLRAGLNLTFGIGGDDEPEQITSTERGYVDVTMGDVHGLNMEGNKVSVAKIRVEETQYSELFPLIPYVFYEEKAETPSTRTQTLATSNQAGSFNIDAVTPDAVTINSSTLDIIGVRMQQDKNSSIKLIGTVDGKTEGTRTDLAQKRAQNAKDYLVRTYGIDGNRITVEASGLPAKPSSIRDKEGVEENRRVEIVPVNSNSSLLKPIIITSDKQRIATPPVIVFVPNIQANEEIASWDMEIKQSDRLLKRYSGYDKPESIHWSISSNELSSNEIPVDYRFIVRTKSGIEDDYSGSIPVDFITTTKKIAEEGADKTISKYSLVLFDFDSPNVSDLDRNVLNEYVIPNIKMNSTVQIYGYTDRIGDDSYNKKLALSRANAVKEILQSRASSANYEVFGVGEGVQIYDNNLPTGRQLSRTVQIYIVTPKN